MADEIIVLVTCPKEESESIAQTLVSEHLAACVNIIDGIRSIYLWQGKVCNEMEQLLVIKSTVETWDKLRDRVLQMHSYEVPEIISIPVQNGYQPYINWIKESVEAGRM